MTATLTRISVLAAALAAGGIARPAGAAKGGHPARRSDARTGRIAPALAELVKASKRGDRAALGRAADRLGPGRLAQALGSKEPAVGEAALAAVPLARGGVLLVGAVAAELWSSEPARAIAAAGAIGALLDGDAPSELEDWDVPPDVVAWACGALKAQPTRAGAPVVLRLAALDAIAEATPTCGELGDVGALARDPSPAVRRAAALLGGVGSHRSSLLREAVADPDAAVSSAAAAVACRVEARQARGGKPEPPSPEAIAAARARAGAAATPADDAVEMLDCLAAAGTPADAALIDQLRHRPPSPLRDRAVELGGAH